MGMAKAHTKTATKLFKELQKKGFKVERRNNGYKLCMNGKPYFTHGTEASFHAMKRDIRKIYGISV